MTGVDEVDVVCCGEVVFRHFVVTDDRSNWRRQFQRGLSRDAERMAQGSSYPVVSERPLSEPLELAADYKESLRRGVDHHVREELVCVVNPEHREVARRDKLVAALDTLAGNGVSSWPLIGISRILKHV